MKNTMQQLIDKAYASGFEHYWTGLESNNCPEKGGMAKAILLNRDNGDVIDVWENGQFEVYNQFGQPTTFIA